MNPLIAPGQFEFNPSALTALEDCSEVSVYAPGYIQPYGVLLILQEPHLTILQVSENVEKFLDLAATALVGQPLQRLFSRSQVKRVAEFLRQDNLEQCNPFVLKTRAQTFRGTLHRIDNALILELEPQSLINKTHSIQFYHQLQTSILSLRSAISVTDLAQTLAKQVKAMTGFDRVMIYRFAADDHGVVIAEERETHLESYLGLHFPAIDIPAPARKLFLRNWVRQIPDINYTPAPLISADDFHVEQPIDMSNCILRGVSPYHIEYLQNMGVAGSLTISLIDDQRLWGLIACHHYSPNLVNYETRKTCEFLGQFASIEFVRQQERELDRYRTQIKTIQDKLQQSFLREPNFIQQVLTQNATELLNLVHAEGMAIALDQQISLLGQTPTLEEVQALLTWLPQLDQSDIYPTNCLIRLYPPASAFTQVASGILAISIMLHHKSYHILWFRPEQVQTVNWAGNPQDAVVIDDLGNRHLCPRKSFELWKETVRETSLPWQLTEVEAARMMQNILMMAVLEFSQTALEQAAERATIANRAKSQFLAKMSHELRTPLNAILGFTQIMHRNSNIPTDFQEPLNIINRSGEHLLSLINDVLEMARIESGQLILAERYFNLHRLLRSLQEMFTLKAAQKGLELLFKEDPDVPNYVCSDEAKLRQILINLISNALKFTTQGSVVVQVSIAPIQDVEPNCTCYPSTSPPCHALRLAFVVQDTGCGLDRRDWETVFEAFMQTEQGRNVEGTGLGLSISRQFARLMGGDITVQSTVGQGSIFTCQVVLHQPEAMNLLESGTDYLVVGLEPGQPTYRILVAEDVFENQQLMKMLLESIGFEVGAVENGAEAIAQWQSWQPHLILMDIQMPVMNGYEATRQIRLQESVNQQQRTPIIALTAAAFEDDRTASLQVGCDGYIAKPFSEIVLFEEIAYHLGVRYRYREPSSQTSYHLTQKPLTSQDFNVMSPEWIIQVHEAALDLSDEKLRQLVTLIPKSEQALIEAMTSLIDNFQLEAIANLTQI
ncbi:MAG: response regulator [Oscillatoriophycideae cyanobacterium NC_groundwater_1537_Pr4_S-0.65um_50_18]|nr:response regulator [Oscillatoriophycideae cyanobacterium NC_groundwater_1537_Pr4_S-0.65um_50_18]